MWSPLYISNFNGHVDVVTTLIEAGANINQGCNVSTHMQCHCNTFTHVLVATEYHHDCDIVTLHNLDHCFIECHNDNIVLSLSQVVLSFVLQVHSHWPTC